MKFTARWCGPCRILVPIVAALAAEYAGQVKFLELRSDENPRTIMRFGGARHANHPPVPPRGSRRPVVGAVEKDALKQRLDGTLRG